MFGNRAMKRIFEPKRDEVTGIWRKVRKPNEAVYNLYSSPHVIIIVIL
jgi:hypothetical protein